MSRYVFICFTIQAIFTSILVANPGNAQNSKQLDEIELNLRSSSEDLARALQKIERQTSFSFVFNDADVDLSLPVDLPKGKQNLFNVLQVLANDAKLQFKRINDNIYIVSGADAQSAVVDETPPVIDDQDTFVAGNITASDDGSAIPGVNILLKGTTQGTTSDADGNYRIRADPSTTLVFSFVGYATQEITVGNQTTIDVVMELDYTEMEEIIVIGYGTAKKKDLTGAVARVEAEDFEKQASTSLIEYLNGTVAGFNSNQNPSAAGGGSIEVRGRNSLNASTAPLIVLDGVIYNGSLQDINPADIESIDILKDASSAAVFGSRAASGVVLVTTKKGTDGKPTINFSTKVGVATPSRDFKPYSAGEYTDFRRDYFRVAEPREDFFYHNPEELPGDISVEEWRNYSDNPQDDNTLEWLARLNFFDPEVENFLAGNTVDWYDEVMQTGVRQMYDLSISGKNDRLSYFWSLGYTNNEGIILGDQFATVRSRLNLDAKVNDWFNVGVNAQFAARDDSSVPGNLRDMYRVSPYGSFFN
ncbi:MAG: carboxypeptidase-like regulatory domain-containing protein, partial [Bacteroidota bacterium]